ncbi:MAG TPA: hypothetical protein VK762_01745 [Polyangiaceae bacterium]|jgi:hypothetical protein|nr:hypothetical protein [Polyangiaceae bacterium]
MNNGAASLGKDMLRVVLAAMLSGLLCAGCSGGSNSSGDNEASDGGVPDPFISQVSDFAGFCKWSSAPAIAPADAGGDGIHGDAGLTVYWNKSPPHGATQFPVGTIILKETNDPDPSKRTVFAMAKRTARGEGYNSAASGGADGWEWWSVTDLGNCNVERLWRGVSPMSSEPYAGQTIGDCNGCHTHAAGNDYVWSTALELSHF